MIIDLYTIQTILIYGHTYNTYLITFNTYILNMYVYNINKF